MAQGFTKGLTIPLPVDMGGTGSTFGSGSGIPLFQNQPTINQPVIMGVTDGSNAAAGEVGEYIESVILQSSAVTFTNTVVRDLTSISLTAGDWDVWGNITYPTVGGSAPSQLTAWISSTSATIIDSSVTGQIALTVAGGVLAAGNCIIAPMRRFSLSSTTTIYISGVSVATSGDATGCGGIYARRAR